MNDNSDAQRPSYDPILELLLKSLRIAEDVSDGRLTHGITLNIRGVIVSGTVITREEWSRSHPMLDNLTETIASAEKQLGLPPIPDNTPIYHIHLKEARFYLPGQLPIPTSGMFYRCRLDSVDGFALGSFSHSVQ